MLEFFNTYRADFQQISSIVLALAIWRWGGGPERWLIGLFIATMVMPIYLFQIFALGEPATGPNAWLYLAFDLVAAAGFTLVALGANRNYPLWIAGLQLVVVGTHAVKGMVDDISLFAQVILIVGPAYFQLTLILIGFLRHVRRERRFGSYRDWRVTRERLPLLQT